MNLIIFSMIANYQFITHAAHLSFNAHSLLGDLSGWKVEQNFISNVKVFYVIGKVLSQYKQGRS